MLLNIRLAAGALTVSAALGVSSGAAAQAGPSGTQKTQAAMMNDVPHCLRKLGTLSVMDGDDPSGWTQFQLAGRKSCSRCWSSVRAASTSSTAARA